MKQKCPESRQDLFNQWAHGLNWILSNKDAGDLWPIGVTRSTLQFGHHFWEQLKYLKFVCDQRGLSPVILSRKVEHPTALVATATYALIYTRQFSILLPERVDILGWLLEIASAAKSGTLFNQGGSHLIYSKEHIESVASDKAVVWKIQPQISRALHYLSGLLWSYCEVLFFSNHRIGTEKHGPYLPPPTFSDELFVLIRSCRNLRPSLLWPDQDHFHLMKVEELELVLFYKGLPVISFDILSNIIHHSDLVNNLIGYRLIAKGVDGSVRVVKTLSEITEFITQCELLLSNMAYDVAKLSEAQLAQKLEHISLFSLLPIADQAGIAWEQLLAATAIKETERAEYRFPYGARGLSPEMLAVFCDVREEI